MNRRRLILTTVAGLFLLSPFGIADDFYFNFRRRAAAVGGGVTICDTFDRANADALGTASCGGTWTEQAGDGDIVSNQCSVQTTGYAENVYVHNTSLGSVNGYVKVTFAAAGADNYHAIFFRNTDASSPMYGVFFWVSEDDVTFTRKANAADGSFETVETDGTQTVTAGDVWGVTWTGTGNAIVVRCWLNPTANAPVSASEWDAADTTPECSFTADPTTPVDTGQLCGIGGECDTVTQMVFDNFFAGSLP